MVWDPTVRACETVYNTLGALDQISEQELFMTAGQKKMKELTFFATNAGGGTLDARAKGLALDLDNTFRNVRGAAFADGVNQLQATEAITTVLKQEQKTVEDLSDKADSEYQFFEE